VQWFWEVLKNEMTQEDLKKLIKFCWAQERLPSNDEEFDRRQVRFLIKPQVGSSRYGDQALPKADTCFFNLELPFYSSKELLKAKILLAINMDCDSLNAEAAQVNDNEDGHRFRQEYDDESYGEGGGGGEEMEEHEEEMEEEEEEL
jgi:other hect domain ubiquitin protein ligase E3